MDTARGRAVAVRDAAAAVWRTAIPVRGRAVEVRDVAVAAGTATVLVIAALTGEGAGTPTAGQWLGYGLLAAGGLVLVVRRWAPVAALVATGVCAAGYQAAGFDVFAVAYLIAVYSAVRAGRGVVTVVTSVVLLAALPVAAVAAGEPAGAARGVLELAWLIAAGAAGEALRQAERRADEAERTREEIARRRAGEERLHIARELHDSLTHQISVIKVQSEAAVHVAEKRGEPVPEALTAIREAGREASRELRATLEALRDDTLSPPYGLEQLPDLVRQARAGGLDATLAVDGRRRGVPDAVDRTAYRIVQESLTNIARHARAATASVRVGYRPGAMTIEVDDDGDATPRSAPGHGVGLLGMRERVTALGGDLRAGPRAGGGFSVRAELPLDRTT
ncbi:sensor histidine kinase [Actinoplanes sp. NPDC048796]|uniref:sensor histidine kinase n=1 Tax=Actinoplanes sp. NPDC048796 TaxID=3155640 RepID=UPI0033C758C5